ncbi:hypothetical protein WJX74_010776 [Apatococcus lobatus]|uniref:Right handed beta helix domain-containing protein n=1 Tax=Apatococcus lobatus TaxID=904363 RepID=A0AAW1SGR8_9CHLO
MSTYDAGVTWSPPDPFFDLAAGPQVTCYSEEQKQQQREAGRKLGEDVKRAIADKQSLLEIPRGIYRLSDEPLQIQGSENFTIRGPGSELIVDGIGTCPTVARVLWNTNFVLEGAPGDPLLLDSDPVPYTQGKILSYDEKALTVEAELLEGYKPPTDNGGIKLFTPEGVMLPHTQDVTQGFEDLGGGRFKVKLNHFSFGRTLPTTLDVFQPGNLICIAQPGAGAGIEIRYNHGVRFTDVMCCNGLMWAMGEQGNDVYERFQGCRRPHTSRLIGGGMPLQTFWGGSLTWVDSEVGHNFDDIVDINVPANFAFKQTGPREFFVQDVDGNSLKPGQELTCYSYPHLKWLGKVHIVDIAEERDEEAIKYFNENLAPEMGILPGSTSRRATVDNDIDIGKVAFVDIGWKPSSMRFVNSWFHDGLADGIALKGAREVVVENCLVERCDLLGISVGFDPYWWEGCPSHNIAFRGNTVVDCPFSPNCDRPAINVSAGGEHADACHLVQNNVDISRNLIIGGLGSAIRVRLAETITIADNVIVHQPEKDQGPAAIFADHVRETRICNNTFMHFPRDTWQVPIATGAFTDPSAVQAFSNRCRDPDAPLPDMPWQYHLHSDPAVTREGEGWDETGPGTYPNSSCWTCNAGAVISFDFKGTEVAVRGARGIACQHRISLTNTGRCAEGGQGSYMTVAGFLVMDEARQCS